MTVKKFNLYWLVIPGAVFFILGFATFIIGSFFDWDIGVFFGKQFTKWFGNFLSYWSYVAGYYIVFFAMFLACALLLESYYFHVRRTKHDHWLQRYSWLVGSLYILFLLIYIGLNLYQIISLPNKDEGWGKGIIVTFVDNYHKYMYYSIAFFIVGLLFYSLTFWIMHYRVPRTSAFVENSYWVDGVKIIVYAIMLYLTVGILKIVFGRPYFFSTVYDTEIKGQLEKIPGAKYQDWATWQQLPYHNWWEPFRFVQHMRDIFTFKSDPHVYNNDFPSGHMASALITFSMIYVAIGKKRGRFYPLIVLFVCVMWIQVVITYFGMMIYRFHWMTDMAFTLCFGLFYFVLVEWIFRKKVNPKIEQRSVKPKMKSKQVQKSIIK